MKKNELISEVDVLNVDLLVFLHGCKVGKLLSTWICVGGCLCEEFS